MIKTENFQFKIISNASNMNLIRGIRQSVIHSDESDGYPDE